MAVPARPEQRAAVLHTRIHVHLYADGAAERPQKKTRHYGLGVGTSSAGRVVTGAAGASGARAALAT